MFGINSQEGYNGILDGIGVKTINHGKNMLMSEFQLKKDSVLPSHSHPYEQAGYLVKGSIRLHVNGNAKTLKPGDSWNIPENLEHRADILEDSVAIEVFSPVRGDYLQYVNKNDVIL